MYGYYKLNEETETTLKIGYSIGKNQTCDGVLIYDKNTQEITIKKLSEGADDWYTRWLAGHISYRVLKSDISKTIKMIAVG